VFALHAAGAGKGGVMRTKATATHLLWMTLALCVVYAGAKAFAQDASQAPEVKSDQTPPAVPLKISDKEMKKLFVKRVSPEYPALAQSARIIGRCRVRIVIGTDGGLRDLKLVYGHPILAPAAMDAARKSQYRPYLVEGKPVEVEGEVEYQIP
jgi:TonB family protein